MQLNSVKTPMQKQFTFTTLSNLPEHTNKTAYVFASTEVLLKSPYCQLMKTIMHKRTLSFACFDEFHLDPSTNEQTKGFFELMLSTNSFALQIERIHINEEESSVSSGDKSHEKMTSMLSNKTSNEKWGNDDVKKLIDTLKPMCL